MTPTNKKYMVTSSNGNIFRVTGPLCGEFTGHRWIPSQRPVTRSFDVFFDLNLNKRLSKQSCGWWFETPSRPLWRHCNETNPYCFHPAGSNLPRSGKARVTVAVLWIVVIVMVCSYSANLIVYLSVFERKMPFSTVVEAVEDIFVEFYVSDSSVGRTMLQVKSKILNSMRLCQSLGREFIHNSYHGGK